MIDILNVVIFGFFALILVVIMTIALIGYIRHLKNAFGRKAKRISYDELITKYKELKNPKCFNKDGNRCVTTQPELFEPFTELPFFVNLTNCVFYVDNKIRILSPIGFIQATSHFNYIFLFLLKSNQLVKSDIEQLEEIEKGPMYTTDEVKERLRKKFPYMDIK